MSEPITTEEMAGLVQRAVNQRYVTNIADMPDGNGFEVTAPATGQRFRVTVTEVTADGAVDEVIARFR